MVLRCGGGEDDSEGGHRPKLVVYVGSNFLWKRVCYTGRYGGEGTGSLHSVDTHDNPRPCLWMREEPRGFLVRVPC